MEHDIEFKFGTDPNTLMDECITRLSKVEEDRWRELLAKAWDQGYVVGRHDGSDNYGWGADTPAENPFRQ